MKKNEIIAMVTITKIKKITIKTPPYYHNSNNNSKAIATARTTTAQLF